MGFLLPAIGAGLGFLDFQRNARQEADQEGRRDQALDYLDQWETATFVRDSTQPKET